MDKVALFLTMRFIEQVGLMLRGATIDNIVFGGPAWKVGKELQPGDVILQVPTEMRRD